MTDLFEDFRDLLLELDRGGVEFVIVGGYAVSYYASISSRNCLASRSQKRMRSMAH
jgi:hypothetical protein